MNMNDRGAGLVETALLVPLLLLLFFGVAELGHAYFVSIRVQEAAQEGVTYAAINPSDPSGARTRAVEASSSLPISLANVAVSCPSADRVIVTVSHSVSIVTPVLSQITGATINLARSETSAVLSTSSPCIPSP